MKTDVRKERDRCLLRRWYEYDNNGIDHLAFTTEFRGFPDYIGRSDYVYSGQSRCLACIIIRVRASNCRSF
ncbi:hypothetical protein [Neptuniibacter marinus]|uniref:hypothetical protein n=1 Tax=Neptuniibacter marinus TaxID=1806670 RepID=UPI001E32DD92|nr:hypothetical protein [Neptuniibacter marinus]